MRTWGVSFLILSFFLSSINAAWATQNIEVPPVIVQPYEIQQLNQQMMNGDRQNRDEEIKIKDLIEENNKLTQTTLARQEDEGLARVNQTMLSYRDALVSRDNARIVANAQRPWGDRYGDLIALTEDADAMTVHEDLVRKSGLISEKYQMLTQLKDEMEELNEKLSHRKQEAAAQQQKTIDGFKDISQQQQDKIQMLTQRLSEMDSRIAKYDAIIAEKDNQIMRLRESLDRKDEIIKSQKDEIDSLQRGNTASSPNQMNLPPVIINPAGQQSGEVSIAALAAKDAIINKQAEVIAKLKIRNPTTPTQMNQLGQLLSQKQDQIELLKTELENQLKVNNQHQVQPAPVVMDQSEVRGKDKIIREQEGQITALNNQAQELSSKEQTLEAQVAQMSSASVKLNDHGRAYELLKLQNADLKNQLAEQSRDLKEKTASIQWLNQVLSAAKEKARYYQLTSKQDRLAMEQVQAQVAHIKDDFARHFKDYDQFEGSIKNLKAQVSTLGGTLSAKQGQMDQLVSLNTQLKNQIAAANSRNQENGDENAKLQQTLKDMLAKSQDEIKTKDAKLQENQEQMAGMKADNLAILKAQADKEIYHHQIDDRVALARELIELQQQEAALLDEKSTLESVQNANFDQFSLALEGKIKGLLAKHQIQVLDLENRLQEMQNDLSQKGQEVSSLETELKDKIAEEQNQAILTNQIQDIKAQLKTKDDQVASMDEQIQQGAKTTQELDALKLQMANQQDQAAELKHELENKIAESNKLSAMLSDYQQKLESKNAAYNAELRQVLSSQNYKAQAEKMITYLNAELQDRENQVVKLKKDLYVMQAMSDVKEKESQAKDLNVSTIQQQVLDSKISGMQEMTNKQLDEIRALRTELALARQQLGGMPNSDEIEFLRSGLKKATVELKQKDALLSRIKANADEYEKEFKAQTEEFQSLKEQLVDAQEKLQHRTEDLKYKDMEVTRLKDISRLNERGLKEQVLTLTRRIDEAENRLKARVHGKGGKVDIEELREANDQIKALQSQLGGFKVSYKNTPIEDKLKQALDKIDQQGRVINMLVEKLQNAGQTVDLSKEENQD